MTQLIKIDNEYSQWIKDISQRYRKSQIKAAVRVNDEMLRFYWSLGKDIVDMQAENKWGSSFYNNLSKDLQAAIPNATGLSPRNIRYMKAFYELYSDGFMPQAAAKTDGNTNVPQLVAELPDTLSQVPWGHHRTILDKCKGDKDKAWFFVKETIRNNWSRAMLMNFIDTDLYERQGKAVSNFKLTLPDEESDLAQEMTKDPYSFDFLTLTKKYNEKQLKEALVANITDFLLELGTGFSFVGKEYRLDIAGTELFLDLLFYNIRLRCYVVIEVKVGEFDPRDIGQLSNYVNAVNHMLKGEHDAPTVGLLVCKTKNNVLAQYAVEASAEPIGISEYELSNLLPDNLEGVLPSIEEIEQSLRIKSALDEADYLAENDPRRMTHDEVFNGVREILK